MPSRASPSSERGSGFWDQWDLQEAGFFDRAFLGLVTGGCCCGTDGEAVEHVPTEGFEKREATISGSWEYISGSSGFRAAPPRRCCYQIHALSGVPGHFIYEETTHDGLATSGRLVDMGEWVLGEIESRGELIGTIRLQTRGPNHLLSNFRSHDTDEWGRDIVATRTEFVQQQNAPLSPTGISMQVAVREGDAVAVDSLLRSGHHPDELCDDEVDYHSRGATALVLAARLGNREVVNRLLAEPNVNTNVATKDEDGGAYSGFTPLLWSVVEGRLGAFMSLLRDVRVDYEAEAASGLRAMHLAVLKGSAEMVQALLDVRGDPAAKVILSSGVEVTPLLLAIAGSRPHIVQQLVGELPSTELTRPVSHLESSWVLLASPPPSGQGERGELWKCAPVTGQPVEIRERPELNALQTGNRLAPGEVFRVVDIVAGEGGAQFLKLPAGRGWVVDHKPGVGTMCTKGGNGLIPLTALHYAASRRNVAAAVALLEANADPDTPDRSGRTLIIKAVRNCCPELVISLVQFGADTTHIWSAVRRTQLQGDAVLLDRMLKVAGVTDLPDVVKAAVAKRKASPATTTEIEPRKGRLSSPKGRSGTPRLGLTGASQGMPSPANSARSVVSASTASGTLAIMPAGAGGRQMQKLSTLATAGSTRSKDSGLLSLAPEDCKLLPEDCVPQLHRAVFQKDAALVEKMLKELGPKQAMRVVDGGGLPAVFYALELGYFDIARILFTHGHGCSAELADRLVSVIKDKGATRAKCLRVFQVACEIISNGAGVGSDGETAEGAAVFLKSWGGSLAAFHFFQPRLDLFSRFRSLCKARCKRVYEDIDKGVHPIQRHALESAVQGLPEGPCRQDDDGLLPYLDFGLDDLDSSMSRTDFDLTHMLTGDQEICVCRTLTLLAIALNNVFQADMFSAVNRAVPEAPPAVERHLPKPFATVQSQLLALPRLDDPEAKIPRAMENVDMLRCSVVCTKPEHVIAVIETLQSRYRILSAKNTHVQSLAAKGHRAVTVHVAYDSLVTYGEVFGQTGRLRVDDDTCELEAEDPNGQAWIRYTSSLGEPREWAASLLPLMRAAQRQRQNVVMVAEVQITYKPYVWARPFTELLRRIAACESGPAEMVAAMYDGQFERTTPEVEAEFAAVQVVENLAMASRESASNSSLSSNP